jgi:energy-coupling factor transporter ATP-binding protein EcfA2
MTVLIDVEDVRYRYSAATPEALKGVSVQVREGDFLALVGQNGAGKTTLAKLFNGLLLPTSGSVKVGGVDTRASGVRKLAARVGYCYQNPDHQIFRRTVRQEVAYGPTNLKLPPERVKAQVDHALELVGLQEQADAYPFLLGRGERQRLALASIVAMESEILVVDEPTTGLDYRGVRSIMSLLRRWNQEEGRSIVIITHDIGIVADYVPRTVVMAGGRIVADGHTRDVLSGVQALREADILPPQITRVARRLAHLGVRPDVLTVDEMVAEAQRLLASRERVKEA